MGHGREDGDEGCLGLGREKESERRWGLLGPGSLV